MTRAGLYHASCLACSHCARPLDPSSLLDTKEAVFCKPCYAVLRGTRYRVSIYNYLHYLHYLHRSRSKSRPPPDPRQLPAADDDTAACRGCHGKMFGPERVATALGGFHAQCFKCARCERSLLPSPESACSLGGAAVCRACYSRARSQSRKAGEDVEGRLVHARWRIT